MTRRRPHVDPNAAWMAEAACAGAIGFTEADHTWRLSVCMPCPVRRTCWDADPWPWWGAKPDLCPHGHDKSIGGVTKRGECLACRAAQRRPKATPRTRPTTDHDRQDTWT